jgi:hypothetical protein
MTAAEAASLLTSEQMARLATTDERGRQVR